tara:strand:+ start:67062 stop:68405 length:1344 start_codon:yes stop_codon:yes gene_type:complete
MGTQNLNNLDEGADDLLLGAQGADDATIEAARKAAEAGGGGDDDEAIAAKEKADADAAAALLEAGGGEEGLTPEVFEETSNSLQELLNASEDADTDDNKALRTEMLELFEGGTSFDADGNILDKDGKQLATFEDLVNKVGGQDEITFDATGNQVDSEGKVIATKAQLDIQNSEVNELAKEMGYKFLDDKGQEKLYPEGNEGVKQLTTDIANNNTEKFKKEFFGSNPLLTEVAKHLLGGGDLDSFQKPVDYSKVVPKDLSLANKKNYIKLSYLAEGMSDARATKLSEGLEDNDETTAEAKESLDILQSKQDDAATERQTRLDGIAEQEAKDNVTYWETVQTTVNAGTVDNFTIPKGDRDAFFRYLSAPVKDGLSQDMIDRGEQKLPQELKTKYYRFKNYDVSNVVQEGINSGRLTNLRSRIKKKQELNKTGKSNHKGGQADFTVQDIL